MSSTSTQPDRAHIAAVVLAPSLALAAGIHLGVAAQHGFTSRHGAFFLFAGTAQAALAAIATRVAPRWMLAAALGLSLAIINLWVAARLLGLAGPREPVGPLDLGATALQLTTVASALALLLGRTTRWHTFRMNALALGAATMLAATAAVLAAPSHGHHHDTDTHAADEASHPDSASHEADAEPIFGDLFADHHSDVPGHTAGH
ncbi:MAG: hypothetical protein ABWZ76_00580 [Acidimicrobiales bacterium]